MTALARHTLRAAAMSGLSPTEMLGMLHRALRPQPPETDLCTVCLVALEHASECMRLRVALAGHPPPLLIAASGEVTQLGRPGTLLGVLEEIDINESEAEMRPGETLLLYTDGAPEAGRSDEQLGEQGLMELCRQAPELALQGLLEHIERTAVERAGGKLRDDLALLAIRVSHSEPSRR
jgi:sigma-B regulation protein RsbU (phosphoserine phosphatase)